MRNLLTVCAALVVVLAIMSGYLWRELHAERQLVADLQAQRVQGRAANPAPAPASAPMPAPAPMQAPTASTTAKAPTPAAQIPAPAAVPARVKPTGTALSTSLPDLRVPSDANEEVQRAAALQQSDQTATGRVLAWRDRLTLAGQTLTTAQLQALNAAATTELRRETEESLQIDNTSGPMDAESVARRKEETINRQNETNLRILDDATPQLTADEVKALRTLFEAGHASRLAAARADRERAASGGN